MKHLIIGSGTVGKSTGIWLEANNEEVIFNDINTDLLDSLLKEGHSITTTPQQTDAHIIWICTHENKVDDILSEYKHTQKTIVIRSTTSPGTTEIISGKYQIFKIAHIPEFLREATAIDDIFNPDRVIIGTQNIDTRNQLLPLFKSLSCPIICTKPTTSEFIKLIANNWLSMQISFWNEIHKLLEKFPINKQEVVNAVTLDKRISTYGSKMTGKPFSGFCLPKDLFSMILLFDSVELKPTLFESIKEINDDISLGDNTND